LNFAFLPKANDCFDFWFTVNQREMANTQGSEISFQFWPGVFTFAEIKSLTVAWKIPENGGIIYKNPEPVEQNGYLVWTGSDLPPERSLPAIELLYAPEIFPEFEASKPAPPQTNNTPSGTTGNDDDLDIVLICIIAILVLIFVMFLFWVIKEISSSSYGSGTYIGTPTTRKRSTSSSWTIPSISVSSPSSSRSKRSTGGGGTRSGRTSSCACVSSCACACAGSSSGGRAGCSRKGFNLNLKRFIKKP
jgi:hypothetical protein